MTKIKSKKVRLNSIKSPQTGKTTMMDQLSIGMVVDISRSDGRTHSAVISKIRPDANMVDVEWFEANETKGKAIDFATLLRHNPSIVPLTYQNKTPQPRVAVPKSKPEPKIEPAEVTLPQPKLNKNSRQTIHNFKRQDFNLPSPIKASNKSENTISQISPDRADQLTTGMNVDVVRSDGRKHSAVVSGIRPEVGMVDVEWFEANETKGKAIDFATLLKHNPRITIPTHSTKVTQPKTATPKQKPEVILEHSEPVQNKHSRQSVQSVKEVRKVPAPIKEPRVSLANVSKHQVVLKNEEIERNRLERRAQQAEERRMRDDLKGLDPGNPNWEFFKMIRDYRAGLEFKPLRASDPVIDDRICVCVRKRPLSKKERNQKEIEVVTIPTKDQIHLHQPKYHVDMTKYLENQKFRFDYAFDDNVDNEMVYRFTAQPLVDTIFQGGFATCFAYGQTGSGKTHTMGGDFEGKIQDCSKGIYALCAYDVFNYLDSPEYSDLGLYVVCSFFELYGSKPFDLLAKRAERKILEDNKKNVQIVGLKEVEVANADQVLKLIREGSILRTAGQTSANSNSSRSHAVFQIILKREDNSAIYGKFSLIDLAGSERGADTKASESTVRREGGEINKSLLALKECIRAMGMMKKHVPFRQSKLTLVLRDSFIGKNAKTCMIATISPGLLSAENTLNTLRYANRAKELDSEAVDENFSGEEENDEEIEYSD